MLPSTTVVIRGLHLFGNKRFKAFLEGQMSEDKPTLLLAIEINFFSVQYLFSASVTTSH